MSARPPVDPRQWGEARRWLARVDEDLRAADALLAATPPALGAAAFHCQQAAEKMAKAVLIALRQPPPKLHDIEELGRRIRAHDAALAEAFEEFAGLTRWYVSARYPDAGIDEVPPAEELHDIVARLYELCRRIENLAPE